MRTRSILAALLGFAQPLHMVDLSASAVDQLIATEDHDAAADPASDAGELSAGAPAAAGGLESGTSSSAAPASLSSDTAATGAQQGDADEPTALADTDFSAPHVTDPTPAVSIDIEDHAEARERFAGLMAKLRGIEHEAVESVRAELRELGTLLHLHSVASGKADATGDYSSSDLS